MGGVRANWLCHIFKDIFGHSVSGKRLRLPVRRTRLWQAGAARIGIRMTDVVKKDRNRWTINETSSVTLAQT